MSDDLTTEIKIGVDASGVDAGVGRAKRSLADLGVTAKKAGKDAGDGVGSIGTGGDKAARDVERATKSMQGSLQRLLAEQKAGTKGSREYYEALADTRGISRSAIKPILDQIDAAKSKTLQAKTAADSWTSSLGKVGPLVAAAFSGAAITGFLGKVVSVQREFDVLNSSLKTVTGSSAAAEREMAWLKDFAKETPFGLAQATQGFVKMKALGLDPTRAALTSFGNTASAMGKDLNQMIEAVADASTGEFERLKEFGIKAKKEGDQVSLTFQGVTTTIQNSAADITKYLENIGNTSFGGAMEERAKTLDGTIAALGDTWDELFRTVSTNNVGSLIFDSVTLANGALEDATTLLRAMGGAAQDASRDTGALSTIQNGIATVFETVAVLGANLKYVLVQIGNEIDGLAAQVAQAAQFNFSGVAAIHRQMVADAEAARKEIDATTARILNARKEQEEYARWATRNASAATDPRRLDLGSTRQRETPVSVPKPKKVDLSDYDKLIQKLGVEIPKSAAEAEAAQMGYNKAQTEFLALAASPAWAKFTTSQRATVAALFENKIASEEAADAAKTLAKANLDAAASREKYLTSLSTGLDKIQADIAAQKEATARMGLSKQAIADLDAAKLEMLATDLELQAIKAMDRNLDRQTYDALKKQAAGYRELAKAKQEGAAKEASIEYEKASADAAQKAQEDWRRAAEDINQSLTDALLRGFESGKDFAKNMRDTVVNMFKTMVLKPVIQMVLNPISLGLSSLMSGGAAMAGQGGAGSLLGLASNASSAYNLATGGFGSMVFGNAAAYSAMTPGLTLGSQQAAMLAAQTGKFGLAGATATAQAGGAGMGGFGGLLSSPLGIAAVGAGLAAAFGLFRKTVKRGDVLTGTLGVDDGIRSGDLMRKDGFLFGGPDWFVNDTGVSGMNKAIQAQWDASLKTVEQWSKTLGLSTDKIEGFTTTLGTEKLGDHGQLGIRLDKDGTPLSDQEIQAKIAEAIRSGSNELAQQLIGTWETSMEEVTRQVRNSDLDSAGGLYGTVTEQVERSTYKPSEYAREGEEAIDTLTRLGSSLTAVNAAFETLNLSLFDGSLAGADLASQLIDAAGGMEAFASKTGSYFQNYYSQIEQQGAAYSALTDQFADLNLAVPASRAELRALVESLDLTTEAGRTAFGSLMSLQDGFAGMVSAAQEATGLTVDSVKSLFSSVLEQASSAAEAQQMAADQFSTMFADSIMNMMIGNVSDMLMNSVIAPLLDSVMLGSITAGEALTMGAATSAAVLAEGGAMAGGANFAGGAAAAGAMAAGGSSAAGSMASGGASAGASMAGGGAAAGGRIDAAIASVNSYLSAMTAVMKDPSVQSAIKEVSGIVGSTAGQLYRSGSSFGASVGGAVSQSPAQKAKDAADKLAESLKKLGETMMDEVMRIRGLVAEDASHGMAYWQSQFTIDTAKARAGDADAAAGLVNMSRTLLGVAKDEAGSMLELQRMRAWVAQSLQDTSILMQKPGSALPQPPQTVVVPQAGLAPQYTTPVVMADPGTKEELRELREQNRAQAAQILQMQLRIARSLESLDDRQRAWNLGTPLHVREVPA